MVNLALKQNVSEFVINVLLSWPAILQVNIKLHLKMVQDCEKMGILRF